MKVLIIDDHAILREGLKSLLLNWETNAEVFEVGDAIEALEIIQSTPGLDLVLLDLNVPGVQGYDLLESLLATSATINIAVFSVIDKPSVIREVLARGAKGYIPKSVSPEVLKSAINLILSGSVYVPPSLLETSSEIAAGKEEGTSVARNGSEPRMLTARQSEIVELLLQGKTNKEIGVDLHMSTATVRSHLTVIFRQLNVKNRTEAVNVARTNGLV